MKNKYIYFTVPVILAVIFYFLWMFSASTMYVTPDEERFYLYNDENTYLMVSMYPDNEIIIDQFYFDNAGNMAAESRTFDIKGQTCKKLFGNYYFYGNSIFSVLNLQKAPENTKPAFVSMTCTSYTSYGIDETGREKEGSINQGYIYYSDDQFIINDMVFNRIEEEDIPSEIILLISVLQ